MARTRPPYPKEFREQIVALAHNGRTVEELAAEFEPTAQTIRNWLKKAKPDNNTCSDGLAAAERDELRRLRKENQRLKQERDILAKAAAWFARETDTVPPKSSRS